MLKANLKSCDIPFAELKSRASDRTAWRNQHMPSSHCRAETFELNRVDQLKEKSARDVNYNLQLMLMTADATSAAVRVVQGSACSHTDEFIVDKIR